VRGRAREQRGNQLARHDLHPTGLAGHEEDQIQADVGLADAQRVEG